MEKNPTKFKIGGYIKIPCDFDSLKRGIYEFGVLLAGFRGSDEGWKSAYIKPPKSNEQIWGHAVSLISFNKDYIKFQNSWSKQWGENGYGYFDRNYLPFECWAVTIDRPNEFLADQNNKPTYQFKNDLFQGSNNNDVKILQDCLKYLGCMAKEQESTGTFGNVTRSAVVLFQQRYGIKTTGNVGPITRDKLNSFFLA
jgi:hypothetical protein